MLTKPLLAELCVAPEMTKAVGAVTALATRRRVTQSSSWLISTLSDAPHAHHTLIADNTHRAHELAKQLLAAKLMKPPFSSTPAECPNRTKSYALVSM